MQQLRSVVLTTNDCFKVCQQASQIARIERTGNEVTDNELKRLKGSLVTVGGLKIKAADEPDLFPIQLSMFTNLVELELFECPPSCVTDFHFLRTRLTRLKIERAWIPYLKRLFAPPDVQLPEQAPMVITHATKEYNPLEDDWKWEKLTWLSLSSCAIDVLDEGLHLLSNVQTVDLSRNQIREVRHLQDCYRLERLDLSYNRLSDLQSVYRVLGNIRHLVLARNQISSTKGLDKLFALISLDLGWNHIADYLEVSRLAKLPCLESIRLEGNPIYEKEGYRVHVFGLFMRGVRGDTDPPMLDGERPSESELCNLPTAAEQFPAEPVRASMSSMSRFLTDLRQPSVSDFGGRQSPVRQHSTLFRTRLSDGPSAGLTSEQFPPAEYGESTASARLQVNTGAATDEPAVQPPVQHGKRRAHIAEIEDVSSEPAPTRPAVPYFIVSPPASPKVEAEEAKENLTSAPPQQPQQQQQQEQTQHEQTQQEQTQQEQAAVAPVSEPEVPKAPTRVKSFRKDAQASQPIESPSLEDSRKARSARLSQYKSKIAELRDSIEVLGKDSELRLSQTNLDADMQSVAPTGSAPSASAAAAGALADGGVVDGESEQADMNSNGQSHASEQEDADPYAGVQRESRDSVAALATAVDDRVPDVHVDTSQEFQPVEQPGKAFSPRHADAQRDDGVDSEVVDVPGRRSEQKHKAEVATPVVNESDDEEDVDDELGAADGTLGVVRESEDEDRSRSSYDGDNSIHERSALIGLDDEGDGESKTGVPIPAFGRGASAEVVASSYKSNLSSSVMGTSYNTASVTSTSPDGEEGFARHYSERRLSSQIMAAEASRDSYVGDSDYANLPVADNLELYFKEQVWPMRSRGSGLPYLAQAPGGFYEPPTTPETFVLLFREKICFVRNTTSTDPSAASSQHAKEEPVLIVITDLQVYIVLDRFPPTERFNDAPRPLVLRQHPLVDLQRAVLSFGFQRVTLEFEVDAIMRSRLALARDTVSYAIITRDKPRTHAIISRVPPMANELRQRAEPPRNKTRIDNSDRQLLDETSKIEGTVSDIVHYQLLFQRWKRRPGEIAPRSLILTSEHLLLCEEDFTLPNVTLRLIDKASISDVLRIRSEDDPLHLTFIFKPTSVFGPRRKWRLVGSLRGAIEKLRTEARRLCPQAAS